MAASWKLLFLVVYAILILPNVASINLEPDDVVFGDDKGPVTGDLEVLGDVQPVIWITAVLHKHGDEDGSLVNDLAIVVGRDAYVAEALSSHGAASIIPKGGLDLLQVHVVWAVVHS